MLEVAFWYIYYNIEMGSDIILVIHYKKYDIIDEMF